MNLLNFFFSKEHVTFKSMVDAGALIIDVRSPQEFEFGHIENSINIPVDILQRSIPGIKKMGKAVITVCRSGARSSMAQSILAAAGIEAYNGGPWSQLQKQIN